MTIQVEQSDNSGLAFGKEEYITRVWENTTKTDVIAVVTVLGAALNENLQFSLLNPNEFFEIGPTSGAIKTTGKIFDREKQENYELVVEVRSEDHTRVVPRVAHVIVRVEVLDLNDNAPVFVNQPYHAVMSRDAEQDSNVITVSAVDIDKGKNGDIFYQLVKGNGELFRVGRKSGQVTLRKPSNQYMSEYKLTVAAYDGGTPPFSDEANVLIKVIDESVPVFSQMLYKASVKEDVEPFSPVVSVEAEAPTKDGKVIYTLGGGNEEGVFSVDYNSGVISVTEELDFEKKPHHQIKVKATDVMNGGFAEATVLIGVEDVNDCQPRFVEESYNASISEAVPRGTFVTKVTANDVDSGRNKEILYDILRDKKNSADFFSINAETGEIFLKRQLDYERSKVHTLTVIATDQGARPLSDTVTVTIFVEDTNDNSPNFEDAKYFFKLSDRAERNQFVGKVTAIDQDDSDDGKLSYSIIGGNEHQVFAIDKRSGIISLVNLHK